MRHMRSPFHEHVAKQGLHLDIAPACLLDSLIIPPLDCIADDVRKRATAGRSTTLLATQCAKTPFINFRVMAAARLKEGERFQKMKRRQPEFPAPHLCLGFWTANCTSAGMHIAGRDADDLVRFGACPSRALAPARYSGTQGKFHK